MSAVALTDFPDSMRPKKVYLRVIQGPFNTRVRERISDVVGSKVILASLAYHPDRGKIAKNASKKKWVSAGGSRKRLDRERLLALSKALEDAQVESGLDNGDLEVLKLVRYVLA
jgi:hypothetical protein